MVSAKNRVKLDIGGCEICVASEESEDYIKNIAQKVDEHIKKLMDYSPSMSTTMAAIFAAMDFCDESLKEKEAADNLRSQIKEYFDDAAQARAEAQESRRREEAAETELQRMKAVEGLKALKQQKGMYEK